MLLANNPAVNLATRCRLRRLIEADAMDERTLVLVVRALEKTRPRSHGGWVSLLAEALGASRELALQAGSTAEVICAAVDLVDDVQDGDARAYLSEVTEAVRINLASHLWVIASLFTSEMERDHGRSGLTLPVAGLSSAMACGQHMELTRPQWSMSTYARMSKLTSSRQLEAYFRVAAFASDTDMEPFVALSDPLGVLIQIRCDEVQGDARLTCLPPGEVLSLRREAERALVLATRRVPSAAQAVVRGLVDVVGCLDEGREAE